MFEMHKNRNQCVRVRFPQRKGKQKRNQMCHNTEQKFLVKTN